MQKVKKKKDNFILKRHIIIGGSGFLGKEIIKNLMNNKVKNILVVDIKKITDNRVKFIKCDISVRDDIDRIDFKRDDIVHHLASKLIIPNKPRNNRFDFFFQTTVRGTKNLVKAMKKGKCDKLIFWSTDMVYGHYSNNLLSENSPLKPLGPYGKTKLMAEKFLLNQVKKRNLKCTIFRPRLIIGEGRLGILKNLFILIKYNLPIPLIGDGNNFFQFVSVKDCAKASILACEKNFPSRIYNLGSNKNYKVKYLLKQLIKKVNSYSVLFAINIFLITTIFKVLNFFKISPLDKEQFEIANQNVILSTKLVEKDLGWKPEDDDINTLVNTFKSFVGQNETNCNF